MINHKRKFQAIDPATGNRLAGDFFTSGISDAEEALNNAAKAFGIYKSIGKNLKGAFLRAIADELTLLGDILINRAAAESGLPVARLQGELGRTTGQLKFFAGLVEEGSWVNAIIDVALPDRQPLPRPDIRRMLMPIGPVVVFGASNFPLAFSVAGGDTASALAAGCPVIVKAHPAHPGTSELVAEAIHRAIDHCGLPKGVFSILYDDGYEIGKYLVMHPMTKCVTFTGSYKGGMALQQMALERKEPIPVFTEMGSINPVILLPEAINNNSNALAVQMAASITMGAGQFCTNPGLMIAMQSESLKGFIKLLSDAIAQTPPSTMLSPGICANYKQLSEKVLQSAAVTLLAESVLENNGKSNQSVARLASVNAVDFLANVDLQEEVFGPFSLLILADDANQIEEIISSLGGQLTITVMAHDQEIIGYEALLNKLSDKAGRLIMNAAPTGVEVCAAMQHGGPFPATSDSRFTSVGSTAVYRFARPVAWQGWNNELLPAELKDGNPLEIFRLIDQKWTKD